MIQFNENDIHVILEVLVHYQSILRYNLRNTNGPTEYKEIILREQKNIAELIDKITEAPKHWYK